MTIRGATPASGGGSLSRRGFLSGTAGAAACLLAGGLKAGIPAGAAPGARVGAERLGGENEAWSRRVRVLGQVNLTGEDTRSFDIQRWRNTWSETGVEGVIANAGGILFFYPSQLSPVELADPTGNRDLFGEIVAAARQAGLSVMARMDTRGFSQAIFDRHPEWGAIDARGEPFGDGKHAFACINSAYRWEFIPEVFREILTGYDVQGFADNWWSGPSRAQICHCRVCHDRFRKECGLPLPLAVNWDDPDYRMWVRWGYRRRTALWAFNNDFVRSVGGSEVCWVGMMNGGIDAACELMRDMRGLLRGSDLALIDHQRRNVQRGFPELTEAGMRISELTRAGGRAFCCAGLYRSAARPHQVFRHAAQPRSEVRLMTVSSLAGGFLPWWHMVGGSPEDGRILRGFADLFQWRRRYDGLLQGAEPVADVGVVWSQENRDFFGRDDAEALCDRAYWGTVHALSRAGIPWRPVHLDDLPRFGSSLKVLVMPQIHVLGLEQAEAVAAWVESGGGLVLSGRPGICDLDGHARARPLLENVVGVRWMGEGVGTLRRKGDEAASPWDDPGHTYLRPWVGADQRQALTVPRPADDHSLLLGLESAGLLPFGGHVDRAEPGEGTRVVLQATESTPWLPTEFCRMPESRSGLPALLVRESSHGGRCVVFAADLDRCHGRDYLPDHARLITNAIAWAAGGPWTFSLHKKGWISANLQQVAGGWVLHLVNLNQPEAWERPVIEIVPGGPMDVTLNGPAFDEVRRATSLVTGNPLLITDRQPGTLRCHLDAILEHEVIYFQRT